MATILLLLQAPHVFSFYLISKATFQARSIYSSHPCNLDSATLLDDDGPLQFGIGFELPAYPVVEGTPPGAGNSVDICVSSFVAMPVGVSVTVITTTGSADSEFKVRTQPPHQELQFTSWRKLVEG